MGMTVVRILLMSARSAGDPPLWANLNIDRGNTQCKGDAWHGAQSSSRQSLSCDLPPRLHSDFMCLPRQRSIQVKV